MPVRGVRWRDRKQAVFDDDRAPVTILGHGSTRTELGEPEKQFTGLCSTRNGSGGSVLLCGTLSLYC